MRRSHAVVILFVLVTLGLFGCPLLGDESHEEAVDACYDGLRLWVEE
jgi:hypothetical protein